MNNILDRFTGNISPVALLISSFFWSWVDIVAFSPALFSTIGSPVDPLPFLVAFAASSMALGIFAVSSKIRKTLLDARVFGAFSLICGSVGTLAVWIGIPLSPLILVVGGIFVGVYQSAGAVVAGSIATCQGTTNALIHLAAALPLNIVAVILMIALKPLAAVAFAVILPLLSAVCFALYLSRRGNAVLLQSVKAAGRKPGKGHVAEGVRRFGFGLFFIFMVFGLCVSFGFVNSQTMFVQADHLVSFGYAALIVRAATSLVVLAGYLLFAWRPYSLLRIAFVLMSVGLIASGVIGGLESAAPLVSTALILTGYACFDLLIWTLVIMMSYRSGISLLRMICIVYAVDQFGIFIGSVQGLLEIDSMAVTASYIFLGGVMLFFALGFSDVKNPVGKTLGLSELEFGIDSTSVLTDEREPSEAKRQDRIGELAERFFLTAREKEVLSLLIAGRNGPYISERLFISENTVKSHIRHIYTKLDVHDRQELLDLAFPLHR